MDEIRSFRRRKYGEDTGEYINVLEVQAYLRPDLGREKQHLIEEKIDILFDEVGRIMMNESDRTA